MQTNSGCAHCYGIGSLIPLEDPVMHTTNRKHVNSIWTDKYLCYPDVVSHIHVTITSNYSSQPCLIEL